MSDHKNDHESDRNEDDYEPIDRAIGLTESQRSRLVGNWAAIIQQMAGGMVDVRWGNGLLTLETVNNIMDGKREATLSMAATLAEKLGVTVGSLLLESPDGADQAENEQADEWPKLQFDVWAEIAATRDYRNAPIHLANELRRIAAELVEAAEHLEERHPQGMVDEVDGILDAAWDDELIAFDLGLRINKAKALDEAETERD